MTRPYARQILPAISFVAVLGMLGISGGLLPAAAQAPATLSEAQDVNGHPGIMAEVVQCKREAGVLSIRMRLRNTGEKSENVLMRVPDDKFYVTSGSKKYLVLRDSGKVPLASPDDYATVAMRYSMVDRTLDRASGRMVEGATSPQESTELWTFRRTRGGHWVLSAVQQS